MKSYVWLSLLAAALVTYSIRALPLTLIRKPIRSRFLKSFLYYVPFVTLAAMIFPDMVNSTQCVWSGIAGFVTAIVLAWFNQGLFKVSLGACAAVFLVELFF